MPSITPDNKALFFITYLYSNIGIVSPNVMDNTLPTWLGTESFLNTILLVWTIHGLCSR